MIQVIAVALEQYTEILEGFVREEFEYQRKEAGEATSPGSLFDMARYQLTGGQPSPKDEIKPHDVTPEVCSSQLQHGYHYTDCTNRCVL